MSLPTDEYWVDRAARRELYTAKRTDDLVLQVKAMHERAQAEIERELRTLIRRGRANTAAGRRRVSELRALQARIDVECTRLANQQITRERDAFAEAMQEEFARHWFDLQQDVGTFFDFTELSQETIDEALEHSWSGRDYSRSVWDNTHEVAKVTKDILQDGLLSNRGIASMTARLRETFDTATYKAARVIRTEMNYLHNQADLHVYERLGAKEYRFLATLDSTTCQKCGALDNKTFPVAEAEVGVNYPPLHPNDRCVTVPVIEGEALSAMQRRYRDPISGKTTGTVPADMTYEQWKALMDQQHGAGTVDKARQMAYNRSADKEQFDAYKSRLGADAPKTFEAFQKLKYDNPAAYAELMDFYRYKGRVAEATADDFARYQKIKATGVVGSIRVPPKYINIESLVINDEHALRHGCTIEDAKAYVEKSKCSITRKRWDGYHTGYYSFEGAAYIEDETSRVKTMFSSKDFDPIVQSIVEVFT